MRIAVCNLDEVSEDFVVSNLQRADSRPGALLSLNTRDSIFPAVSQRSPFVEAAVYTFANACFISNRDWRSVDKRLIDF
jgi:hypothetical protein